MIGEKALGPSKAQESPQCHPKETTQRERCGARDDGYLHMKCDIFETICDDAKRDFV